VAAARQAFQKPHFDPYQDDAPVDLATEYPSEGVDTMGAIPEDLLVHSRIAQVEASTETALAGSLSTSPEVSQAPTPAEAATPAAAPSPGDAPSPDDAPAALHPPRPDDAPAPLDAPSDDSKPHSP
jgi:hypothetical protein